MRTKKDEKFKLESVEELLGVVNEESAMDIEISKIQSFRAHPFKVLDDDKMQELIDSISVNGILTPVLVRPLGMDTYEMISGHRRMHAAKIVGLTKIPTIIREMTDDEAVINMVDANVQREELLPSEKAFAYRMKLDAMKRQAGRPGKNNVSQNETNLRSDEILAKEIGTSRNQIQRYIRLTELIPELLDMVDRKKLQFTVAVDISYIDPVVQQWLYEYIRENGFIKPAQVIALRKYLQIEKVNQQRMIMILNENMPGRTSINRKITFSEDKLSKYFPPFYSQLDMENIMIELLEEWKKKQKKKKKYS